MTTQEQKKSESKLFSNPLKDLEISQIETAIADAVGGLLGKELESDIERIDFHPNGGAFNGMRLTVTVKQQLSFNSWASAEPDGNE